MYILLATGNLVKVFPTFGLDALVKLVFCKSEYTIKVYI